MMTVISAILAVAKAIPTIDSLIQQLVAAYVNSQIDKMKKENTDAIRTAIQSFDQRAIEKAMGNPNPGAPSDVPNSKVVDSLPGVPNP